MGRNQKRGQPKNSGQFASENRGAAAPTSADGRTGLLSRLFGRDSKPTAPQSTLDPNNPFADIVNNYDSTWNDFQTKNPAPARYETPPRPRPAARSIDHEAARQDWSQALRDAKADYRYGVHEPAHNRVASLMEAHDRNTHGPFTYRTSDGQTREMPLDTEASSRYIHSIAQDVVDLHDRGETSDRARGSRNVYSRQTVELAREIASARQSSPAGASTHDYYTAGTYTQPDGTTTSEWHLKPRVGMLLSNIERDHNNSSALQEGRADQEKRRAATAARFSEPDW